MQTLSIHGNCILIFLDLCGFLRHNLLKILQKAHDLYEAFYNFMFKDDGYLIFQEKISLTLSLKAAITLRMMRSLLKERHLWNVVTSGSKVIQMMMNNQGKI